MAAKTAHRTKRRGQSFLNRAALSSRIAMCGGWVEIRRWSTSVTHPEQTFAGSARSDGTDVARWNHRWGLLVPEPRLAGMTTNERLLATGLMDAFGQAARMRDRDRMIEVLGKVELADQAGSIADGILADPKRYGF